MLKSKTNLSHLATLLAKRDLNVDIASIDCAPEEKGILATFDIINHDGTIKPVITHYNRYTGKPVSYNTDAIKFVRASSIHSEN